VMTETTATLDLLETIRVHETAGIGVKTPTTPVPAVIATTEDIQAGSVMIKSGARLPESAPFESKPYGHWKLLAGVDGFAVERTLSEAGWHFFFMVPETMASAVSSTPQGAVRKALKKVTAAIETQDYNALEVVGITTKRFLGLHYATVVAHARHSKHSPYLRDLDPHYVPRNVWNFKQALRRRGQIGRTSKGI
jgi:hypothetical protein